FNESPAGVDPSGLAGQPLMLPTLVPILDFPIINPFNPIRGPVMVSRPILYENEREDSYDYEMQIAEKTKVKPILIVNPHRPVIIPQDGKRLTVCDNPKLLQDILHGW